MLNLTLNGAKVFSELSETLTKGTKLTNYRKCFSSLDKEGE